jgi:hypothetical protein
MGLCRFTSNGYVLLREPISALLFGVADPTGRMMLGQMGVRHRSPETLPDTQPSECWPSRWSKLNGTKALQKLQFDICPLEIH